jgi:hypothetical protein
MLDGHGACDDPRSVQQERTGAGLTHDQIELAAAWHIELTESTGTHIEIAFDRVAMAQGNRARSPLEPVLRDRETSSEGRKWRSGRDRPSGATIPRSGTRGCTGLIPRKGRPGLRRLSSITRHAEERMDQRRAKREDVRAALVSSTVAIAQEGWRVRGGADRDGDELTVIVDIEARVSPFSVIIRTRVRDSTSWS